MRNGYIKILLFSLVIGSLALVFQVLTQKLPVISFLALAYYIGLTLCIHALTMPSLKSNSKAFVTVFMGAQGIRMFFSFAILTLYLIFTPVISIPFIVFYLLMYLFFAGFEIYLLLSNLRPDFKKGSIIQ